MLANLWQLTQGPARLQLPILTAALAVGVLLPLLPACESTESTEVTKASSSNSGQSNSPNCSRLPGDTCSESACCGVSSPFTDCYTFATGAKQGLCTSNCTNDSQCKYMAMVPAKCVKFKSGGLCLFPCTSNADCDVATGQTCLDAGTNAGKVCFLP